MATAQQNEVSNDYAELVARLRQGEVVECQINLGVYKGVAAASYNDLWYGDLFTLTTKGEMDFIPIVKEAYFIEFCQKNNVGFESIEYTNEDLRHLRALSA